MEPTDGADPAREQPEHSLVRLPTLGRRRDPHLEGIAVGSDHLASARTRHDPDGEEHPFVDLGEHPGDASEGHEMRSG